MALDLSAKPSVGSLDGSSKPPSPSFSSDLDASFDRPSSAFSDVTADKDGATENKSHNSSFIGSKGSLVKPVAGPIPSHLDNIKSEDEERKSPTNSRPFKMYPFEPVPNIYSQMAASAASLSASGMYSPFGAAASPGTALPGASLPGLPGFLDHAISMSSPITQYIQQKKRRSENRANGHKNSKSDDNEVAHLMRSPSTNSNNSQGDISSTSRDNHQTQQPQFPENFMPGGEHSPATSPSEFPTPDAHDANTPAAKRQKTSGSEHDLSLDERRELSYWDRRRKNNEAAKRSRDARRAKEEEIAMRAAFLEQENLKLRAQVTILKNETAKLHYMLYNRL